jgi:hypothetical protein
LDVGGVSYATDAGDDAATGDSSLTDAASDAVVDAAIHDGSAAIDAPFDAFASFIACEQGPCNAATQSCCLAWAPSVNDQCVDGHNTSCHIDASPTTTVMLCDDPLDCLAWSPLAPYCCLYDDGSGGVSGYHSGCVVDPRSCSTTDRYLMCDPASPITVCQAQDAGLSCQSFPSATRYNVCLKQ